MSIGTAARSTRRLADTSTEKSDVAATAATIIVKREARIGISSQRVRVVLAVASCLALLGAGCSGSSEQAAQPEPKPRQRPSGAAKAAVPPAPIPRGTEKVFPRRSYPPEEKLPAFSALKVTDANFPAGIAVAPDGRVFYSELWGGRIRVLRGNGTVDPVPWADVNRRYGIRWTRFYHGGLSGIAFDPEFAKNRFVYVVTQVPSKQTGLPATTLVLRYRDVKGRGVAPRIILTVRAKLFDNVYSLVFGSDEMLYVPSGFLGTSLPEGDPLADRRGEILRVTRDGEAPGDNPYGARAPRVWATGFKNAFDIAFFPGSNLAVAGESGPEAHDEINLVMPGHDYGYPEHQGVTRAKGVTPPLFDYESDRTSPAGILYYTGNRYPALRGRFLMCENHGRGMLALRIERAAPGRLRNLTPLVPACTIDLVQTRDGTVLFTDDSAIYRLVQR
jgi:glucose/arabinose dehydrogenase